ncbi:MAG: type II toxin-antitoxin system VapB family antitoxin [Acidobacteriota bacterium]
MDVALNIKNSEVERLVTEIASMTGETKTEAIRRALDERRQRLSFRVVRRDRLADAMRFLETEVWAHLPQELLDRPRDREAEDEILGYGPEGV